VKILILGATGGTGREVVAQGLQRGHELTALVRNPQKLAASEKLRVVRGSMADAQALADAVRGQDAVISALGMGNGLKSHGLMAKSVPALIAAMEREGVGRLVLTSAFGVGPTRRDVPLVPRLFQRLLLRDIFADKEAGETALRASRLEWTIVYPAMLTDAAASGRYRAAEHLELHGLPRISRADVAQFLLAAAGDRALVGKSLLIGPA
jgi:putative NADH-flavin reductase